jgi:Uma2 family endonuclease
MYHRVMTGDEMRRTALPRLTYEDFLSFPDDGRRHELIDGDHYVTPSPATVHQRLVGRLYRALGNFLEVSHLGEAFVAPFDVVLSNHDVVEPDVLVILNDQLDVLTDEHVRGAPAIVVEILSPGTRRRDETLKRDLYARAGVREYWMVDPGREAVTICRRSEPGVLVTTATLATSAGDALASPLLPEFVLPLSVLFGRSNG